MAAPDSTPAAIEVAGSTWRLSGAWSVDGLAGLLRRPWPALPGRELTLDGSGVSTLDSAGAWQLRRLADALVAAGGRLHLQGWAPRHRALLDSLFELERPQPTPAAAAVPPLARVGRSALRLGQGLIGLHALVGEVFLALGRVLRRPARLRWRLLLHELQAAGVGALLIVGLLSFLMGVVIAYQGAVQLQQYGANLYIADLIGLSMLRELGPLLTAIIVAGRTGSSYTAQIGTMQVTEEVSALRTLGLNPLEVLVLPKLLALVIALPLLSVFADVMGVLGGLLMAQVELGLGAVPFFDRFQEAVPISALYLGLYKTPVFAVIIAVIGCYQGMQVRGGAASVGHHTTLAVVQAISLVILVDAQFSIIYSWLGL